MKDEKMQALKKWKKRRNISNMKAPVWIVGDNCIRFRILNPDDKYIEIYTTDDFGYAEFMVVEEPTADSYAIKWDSRTSGYIGARSYIKKLKEHGISNPVACKRDGNIIKVWWK